MGWLSNLIGTGVKAAKDIGGQVLTNVGTNVVGNLVNKGTNVVTKALTGADTPAGATGNTGGGFDWRSIIAGTLPVLSSLQQTDLPYQKELEGIGFGALDMAKQMTPTALANMQGLIGGPALGAIESTLERQKSQIRGTYGTMGMSGSTAEAQDMAAAQRDATSQQYELGRQMASTGFQGIAAQTGLADTVFSNLMTMQMEKDKELQDALAAYAALFASGGSAQPQTTIVTNADGTVTLAPFQPFNPTGPIGSDVTPVTPINPTQPGLVTPYGPGGLPTSINGMTMAPDTSNWTPAMWATYLATIGGGSPMGRPGP